MPPESVATHLRAVAEVLDTRVSTTMAAFDAASGAERAAAEALATARAVHDRRTRGERATARLVSLEAARPSHLERVAALAAADRAATLGGHLAAHDRAADDVALGRAQVERARSALPTAALAALPDDEVDGVLARARALDGTAAALARESGEAAARARRRSTLEERAKALADADRGGRHPVGRDRGRGRAARRARSRPGPPAPPASPSSS